MNKTKVFSVRLTPVQRDRIQDEATRNGLSFSAYLRACIGIEMTRTISRVIRPESD